MDLSLLVRRTYNEIRWLLFKHNSTPVIMKHTALQVTYPARVTGLSVNDQDVNSTHIVDENQEVTVSCSFVNGNPPVNIRMVDERGNILSSTKYKEGPLVLSLGVFHCHNVWPVIGCEAQGSELNKSVTILIRCAPQLSYITNQVSDLRRILDGGLTFAMKSYKGDVRKCLMAQVQPETMTKEVNCEVSGHAPKFTLTLRFVNKSWIGEGTWTVQVMSEMGPSSITFQLFNSTGNITSIGLPLFLIYLDA
ncbi:uncharacterized protein LOC112568822 [Pomacea canaliculata]|uniref:uncharacterized protein LOC112568822 n=1 Tax=Pomacea canaliculata TaxID=400727 RepID=UPI000D73A422|nr:uncharacterized protein LOC112568822 [Pomacea canaliculata]